VNTVRADATVTAEQVQCSVPYFDFFIGCFYWFINISWLLTSLLQVDTFDEELKKLVGMGFEKVFQVMSGMSILYCT
jgi:hypothetical protein